MANGISKIKLLSDNNKIAVNNITIINSKLFKFFLSSLKASKIFSFSLFTDSSDVFNANIIGIAFVLDLDKTIYLPLVYHYDNPLPPLNYQTVLKEIKPVLEDSNIYKIGHNIKYSYGLFQKYGIELKGIKFDVMLESYILNSSSGKHDIISISERWLGYKNSFFNNIAIKNKNSFSINSTSLHEAIFYTTNHANLVMQLHYKMWPILESTKELKFLFENIEMPLVNVISRLEKNGTLVDICILKNFSEILNEHLFNLQEQAYKLVGESFNILSVRNIQKFLFEKYQITPNKKTPKGTPSTKEEVLRELAKQYSLPSILLEYRYFHKLKSTYVNKLIQLINPITGRIHSSYNQAKTSTGRISSKKPNLQNIPVGNNDRNIFIRKAFISSTGKCILSADYSQIELRILAHFSKDENLITSFNEEKDIHLITASEFFHIPLSDISNKQRRIAKAINFSVIYGISPFGLSSHLNISSSEAKKYIDLYFQKYPKVRDYINNIRSQTAEGYIKTLSGRRIWLPNINSAKYKLRKASERAAFNAQMQGTAADIIKCAMISLDLWAQQHDQEKIKMIIQVHDELVFEVDLNFVCIAKKKIISLMESSITLDVPLKVELNIGKNWYEAH